MISNTVFLIMRNFVKHELLAENQISITHQLPKCDTLTGLSEVTATFRNAWFPALILLFYSLFAPTNFKQNYVLLESLYLLIKVDALIRCIFVSIAVFVNPNKGSALWKRYAPRALQLTSIIVQAVIPLLIMVCTLVCFCVPSIQTKKYDNSAFLLFYAALSLGTFVNFFTDTLPRARKFEKN
jgi:hypothetical protein